MLLNILYPYIKFMFGTLYPAYKTWKALKRKDETTRRRWMKYWISYAAFQSAEFAGDLTLMYILPFYYELKLLLVIWVVVGTKLFFDSIVNKELTKREKSIDKFLTRATKVRDEVVATIWFEVSRCSVKIFSLLMTGGLSVLTPSRDASQSASPICSDSEPESLEYYHNNNNNNRINVDRKHNQRIYNRHIQMQVDGPIIEEVID